MSVGQATPAVAKRVTRAKGRRLAEWSLVLGAPLLPFLWRSSLGVLRIPAGDAWAYQRIVQVFHETGTLQGVGWNDINLLGVLVPVIPWIDVFGFGLVQLAVLTCLFGTLALWATRDLSRLLPPRRRLLVIAAVAGFGGFVGSSATFLVDIYAFAGSAVALACAVRLLDRSGAGSGAHRDSGGRWSPRATAEAGVVVAAVFAFSVRQQTAVLPVAVAWYLWNTGYPRRRVLAIFGSWTIGSLAFLVYRAGLQSGGKVFYGLSIRSALVALFAMSVHLGIALAPFALLGGRWRALVRSRFWRTCGAAFALGVVAVSATSFAVEAYGGLDMAFARPLAWPLVLRLPVFVVVGMLAALGGLALLDGIAVHLVGREADPVADLSAGRRLGAAHTVSVVLRSLVSRDASPGPRSLIARVAALSLLGDAAVVVVSSFYEPRYSMLTVLAGALLLTATAGDERPSRARERWVVAVLAAGWLLSFISLDLSAITARAYFRAAEQAECRGVAATRIDGGFTWNGVHQGTADRATPAERPDDGLPVTPTGRFYPTLKRDAVVSVNPLTTGPGVVQLPPLVVRGLLPGDRRTVYAAVRQSASTGQAACTTSG